MEIQLADIQACKYPDCECIESRLGCAYAPYDMREPHNEPPTSYIQQCFYHMLGETNSG